MTSQQADLDPKRLERVVVWVLILSSLILTTGRLLAVRSKDQHTPMLSANDRSRWCTVRALVDHGTYVIDDVIADRHPRTGRTPWRTIDMVRHRGSDGREHSYSSKPPLLATIVAGEYWILKQLTGLDIGMQPFPVIQCLLIVTNLVPLAVYFGLMTVLVRGTGTSMWGRLFVTSATLFATYLTTFAVTLNNHLPAAICTLIAVYVALPLWNEGLRSGWRFAVAGLFAAQAAAYELPALSFVVLLAAGLFWKSASRTLTCFVPAAAGVAALFFLTNHWAHQSWRPPYAHRKDGPVLARIQVPVPGAETHSVSEELRTALVEAGIAVSADATTSPRERAGSWVLWDEPSHQRLALVSGEHGLEIRVWDNWYEYAGTYWSDSGKQGVDKGEPSRWRYAFHVLIGHHGIFSLTPIWLLSCLGGVLLWRRSWPVRRPTDQPRETRQDAERHSTVVNGSSRYEKLAIVACLTLILTLVCMAFYLTRPLEDRNYGGVAAGFRWLFWLTPLWLLCLVPATDRLATSRAGRFAGAGLLSVSVLSATYPFFNPWSHPWLFNLWVGN